MKPILSSFTLIATGLLLGYGIRLLFEKGVLGPNERLGRLRSFLQRLVLLGLGPVTFAGALWIVEIREPKIALLALIGAFCHIFGGAAAALVARLFRMAPPQAGAFFCCGFFTNVGAIGGLVIFMFLGEEGYAMVPLFKLLEELVYYGIGFPVARLYSDGAKKKAGGSLLPRLLRDPFLRVAVGGLVLGTALNLSGIPRPAFYSSLNSLLIPLSTVLLLASIGMAMRFGKTALYLKEGCHHHLSEISPRPGGLRLPRGTGGPGRHHRGSPPEGRPRPFLHAGRLQRPRPPVPVRPRPGPGEQLLPRLGARSRCAAAGPSLRPWATLGTAAFRRAPPCGSSPAPPPSCSTPRGRASPPRPGRALRPLCRSAP
jgi:Predicted permeases